MAGFFGDSWDDPQSQAVMALAGGLMGGDWKKGLLDYGSTMSASKEADFKKKLQQAQMDKYAADTDMDRQKLSLSQGKERRDSDFEATLMEAIKRRQYSGGVATPNMPVTGSQGGQGISQGGIPNGGQSFGGDPFAGVDSMALMLDQRNNGGKNMGGWVNDATKPQKREQGSTYIDPRTGTERFFPKIPDGLIPDSQGNYVNLPGSLDAVAAMEQAKAEAVARGKAPYSFQTQTLPGGKTVVGSDAQLAEYLKNSGNPFGNTQPQAPQQPPQARPMPAPMGQRSQAPAGSEGNIIAQGLGGLNGLPTTARGGNVSLKSTPAEMDKSRIWQGALGDATASFALAQKSGDTAGMQRAQSDIEGIRREIGGGRPSLAPTQASAPTFGLPLQSPQEKEVQKISNENTGKVNDVFLKSVYTPLIESKGATSATIDSINQSRNSMAALGGTGWGVETKANAANILTGLGIGGKNAEMYATNAQTFQQAAMTRLQSELALQKGPQTEGDSTRQQATYAALKNTPQANAYILDSAQAKAERDLMKARFYESALPIASKKGDLQEIDREWNKRAPSLFSMPSMQKWAKK